MQKGLIILMIIFAVLLFIVIFCLMRKSKISVKYGLIWFLAAIFILLLSILPSLMESMANFLGFELLSNMVLCLFVAVLMFISIALTVMITGQKKKIKILIQEVSILKQEVEKKSN